jgi:hypothetical protein
MESAFVDGFVVFLAQLCDSPLYFALLSRLLKTKSALCHWTQVGQQDRWPTSAFKCIEQIVEHATRKPTPHRGRYRRVASTRIPRAKAFWKRRWSRLAHWRKLRALAVTTMSRAALLQRPSMQSPKSDQALTALCAGCSQLARRLSGPTLACVRECAYLTKAEQPRNLRYM